MGTFSENPKTKQTPPSTHPSPLSQTHFRQGHDPDSIRNSPRWLLQSNNEKRNDVSTGTASPDVGHDFARIPVNPPGSGALRTETEIKKPEDDFRQEADHVRTYMIASSYNLCARIRQPVGPASTYGYPAFHAQPGRSAFGREADSVEEGQDQPQNIEGVGDLITIEDSDSVGATLVYNPSIANDDIPPKDSEFGATRTTPQTSDIVVTRDAAAGVFNVTGTVVNTVKWSVHNCGRTDIPNENAPAITSANYSKVASDLTPNMAKSNGRPPREQFWAQDLTERHERFHANERANTYGRPAFEFAKNWLTAQTATDEAGVDRLVNQIPNKMHESYHASFVPGKERRAYGDGAPLYKARADAINATGIRGGYQNRPLSAGTKAAIGVGGGALAGAVIGGVIGGPIGAGIGALAGGIIGGIGSLLF
ncbi:hypothetical protein [Pseudomonas putida]